jgi:outer membrane protein
MRKIYLMRFMTLFLLLFSAVKTLHAEEISLEQAVDYALEHSPLINGSAASVRASSEMIKTAEAGKLPAVELGYGLAYSDNALTSFGSKLNNRSVTVEDFSPDKINDPGFSDNYYADLTVSLPVYTGGRVDASIDEANANHASVSAMHKRTQATVIYQVKRAYLLAQAAREAIAIAETSTKSAARHVSTTRQLVAENRTVSADNLTARVFYNSVKGSVAKTKAQYQQALNSLKHIMGKDLAADIDVPRWSGKASDENIPALESAIAEALENRNDLVAFNENINAADARTRIADSAAKPQLGIEAKSSLYDDNPLVSEASWGIFAVARMNLYSGGANRSRISAAKEQKLKLEAERKNKKLEIAKEIRNAFTSIDEGKSRLDLALANQRNASKAVREINQRYGEGRTILIDLLQSEQALIQSRSETLNSRLLLESAKLDLDYAIEKPRESGK